jgi:phosphatidylinositol alpha-mannosyltransferase
MKERTMSESNRSLRIAMASYYLPSGSKIGVGYQAHAMANGFADRGHEVTVFSASPSSDGSRYRTVQLPGPRRLRSFAFAFSMRRLDLSSFDVFHAHGDDYWMWRSRVPAHVRTMHGSCFEEAMRIPRAKEKLRMVLLGLSETLASLVADRTVLVSPQTRRWMPWVHEVIPNGVDEKVFSPSTTPKEVRPTILFVGTYLNRKRGALLMEIFRDEVLPAVPDAQLVMVCSDAPDAPNVIRTGRISDTELAGWYQKSWVFCLPSTYEGFGIPYAEAMMTALPVVASSNPGSRYVLGEGEGGVIAEDADLGGHLIRFLTDEGIRKRASEAARMRAQQFRLSQVLDAYEDLYSRLSAS